MPAKLEFSFNATKIGEFPLDKEVMTIGRKEDNDIRIDNLAVSGHHAKLLTIFEDSFLEDLDSTNGTYVNGKSIDKHALKNGDIILIGKHELRYIREGKSTTTEADDSDKTVIIRRPSPAPAQVPNTQNTKPREAGQVFNKTARLQILNGKNAGKEMALEKPSIRLGKPGVQVVMISKRPDGHFIVSLERAEESSSLKVNGDNIGSRSVKLQNHDVIELHKLKIEYYLVD
ncbi:MAG: FHA domain-containing protein [Pseudohongiellaceae bacterium]